MEGEEGVLERVGGRDGLHIASYRIAEKAQGRNARTYNYSHTDHPARLYILSPPLELSSGHASPAPHHNTEGTQGWCADAGSKPALSNTEATGHL